MIDTPALTCASIRTALATGVSYLLLLLVITGLLFLLPYAVLDAI